MDLDELRAAWHRATEKDKPHDAIKALILLEKADPQEPRWAQRLGEAYRRTQQPKEAIDAFIRAFERYGSRGFLPQAIAMAKLVGTLDTARGALLESSLQKAPAPPSPLLKQVVKPPPLPTAEGPKPARAVPPAAAPIDARTAPQAPAPPPPPPPAASRKPPPLPPPLPKVVKPAPMARAADSALDEVRFDDAPDSSVEILLTDFAPGGSIRLDDDDDEPETKPHTMLDTPKAERYDAYGAMASFRLFASISREALVALSNATELVEFVPAAMIVVRNERAFALYAIVSGMAKVIVQGSPEIRLGEGEVFGESSLLDEGTRQADVRAESPLMTLRIEKRALDEVTKVHPEVEDALFDLLARRLIMNLMDTSPLFAAFDPAGRLELAQKFEVRRATPGTVIAERGRRSDGLYVLLAGDVMAEPETGDATRIARGTAFGHASLMGGKSDVTIRAATEAVLLRMPASGFSSLAALYPPVLAHLSETADEPLPMSRRH